MADDRVVAVKADNWQAEVLDSKTPVLVDFWAEWCAPCRAISPILDELSAEFDGRLKIAKVNVDDSPDLGTQFSVRSIPTLLVFKEGTVVEQMIGQMSKSALIQKLEPHVG